MVAYCYVPHASHEQLHSMLADPDRGEEKIDGCLSRGNGLIVWTAHVGNWEFASRLLEMHGRPVNTARANEPGNTAESILRGMMTSERLRIISVDEDALAPLELLRALRRNEIVAIQGDRPYRGRSAEVPFFGGTGEFPAGTLLPVLRVRCPGSAGDRRSGRLAAIPGRDGAIRSIFRERAIRSGTW